MQTVNLRDLGGSGSVVVVLNGSGCPLAHLTPLTRALAETYRVLLPVFPGYDGAPAFDGPYSLALEQRLVEDALLAKGIEEASVVGFSLGGYRALALASGTRLRVRRLVVLSGFASVAPADRLLFGQFATMVRAEAVPSSVLVDRFLSPTFAAANPGRCAEIATWMGQIDKTGLGAELDAVAACDDLGPRLGAITARTLVRVGALDLAAPVAKGEEIASGAPNATLEIVKGAGHLLLFEDFDATLNAVRRALPHPEA